MPIRSIDTKDGTVHIVLADDLTEADLGLIGTALKQGGLGARVQIDFRQARHVSPAGVASLTSVLTALGVSYGYTGLSSSTARLLDYLRPGAPPGKDSAEP